MVLAATLAMVSAAHAGPLVAAIPAIAALGPVLSGLIGAVVNVVAAIGISLLIRAIRKPQNQPETSTAQPGVRLAVEVGDDAPLGFVVGRYATAGTRKYINTWGNANKTPNAYLVDVVQVADIAIPMSSSNRPEMFLNGEECTILWNETPTTQGYPVLEYRKKGKDYLWVRYYDGTQTSAPSYLTSKFGSLSRKAWTDNMIGRGAPLMVVTALVNRELFSGQMNYLFVPPAPAFYDIRKDSTAGGAGSHRWSTPSTWEPTTNPAVIIYNIIRGIYHGAPGVGDWIYGGQNLPAFRVPAANWIAAANACDATVSISGGGSEPTYRCGYEVRTDVEPLTVIEELLKTCAGRLSEVGGIFKLQIGVPSVAVYAFTDDDIIVTREQGFRPFPALDATHNAVEAVYPEPQEAWANKNAPTRTVSALEAADDGRRLIAGVSFPAAPYRRQVQRLMRSMIEEERRFRVHQIVLPPDAWLLEPGDVVSWTSSRNGYIDKKFIVVSLVGERTVNQVVVLKEVDPSDYDWSSEFEFPVSIGEIGPLRAEPQPIVDWFAEGVTDLVGDKQRPAIRLSWDGDQDDVYRVIWEVRKPVSEEVVLNGGTDSPERGVALISHNIFSDTVYQVRGRYLAMGKRETLWSDWLAVTTPNTPLNDVMVFLRALQDELRNELKRREREHDATIQEVREVVANIAAANVEDVVERRKIEQAFGNVTVRILNEARMRVNADEAFAQQIAMIEAAINDPESGLNALSQSLSSLSSTVTVLEDVTEAHAEALLSAFSQIDGLASTTLQLTTAVSEHGTQINAQANLIAAVSAVASQGTASGLMRWMAVSAPSGVSARFALEGKATSAGAYRFGGLYLDVLPEASRIMLHADQVIITDGNAGSTPFLFQSGQLTLATMRAQTLIAARLQNVANTSYLDFNAGVFRMTF